MLKKVVTIVAISNNGYPSGGGWKQPLEQEKALVGASSHELRDRDSNPNFRNQNPASYH
jgi:hypothetical protein